MAPAIKKLGGWEVTHKAGNTIPWENWLYGAFFRGFQKTAGPRYILFIYRPDVAAALCTEGGGSAARGGMDMTPMFFKGACALSVSPLFSDGTGPSGWDMFPDPGQQHRDRGTLHPTRASCAAAAFGFSPGSGIWDCPPLPGRSSLGRRGRQLSPPFERGQQMLSRLLRRWARKQRTAFNDRSSAGPTPPPSPPDPKTPTTPHPCRSPEVPQAPGSPRIPAGTQPASERLPGPWLRTDRAAHLSTLCRPGPAVAVCNREAGRERKFLKSASARTENICPGGKRVPRGARGSRQA